MDGTPLRKFVPGNVAANMAADNPARPLNGRDVFQAASPHNVITGTPLHLIFATKLFQQEIDAVPAEYAKGIEDAATREALALLRAFRAGETARIVSDSLTARV